MLQLALTTLSSWYCQGLKAIPENTRRSASVGTMLGQRRRRWANIVPTLSERLVFSGWLFSVQTDQHVANNSMSFHQTRDVEPVLVWCWASVVDGGPIINQHWLNVSCLLGFHLYWPLQSASQKLSHSSVKCSGRHVLSFCVSYPWHASQSLLGGRYHTPPSLTAQHWWSGSKYDVIRLRLQ